MRLTWTDRYTYCNASKSEISALTVCSNRERLSVCGPIHGNTCVHVYPSECAALEHLVHPNIDACNMVHDTMQPCFIETIGETGPPKYYSISPDRHSSTLLFSTATTVAIRFPPPNLELISAPRSPVLDAEALQPPNLLGNAIPVNNPANKDRLKIIEVAVITAGVATPFMIIGIYTSFVVCRKRRRLSKALDSAWEPFVDYTL